MRYSYKAPTVEEHRVDWYLHGTPGIYDPAQKRGFGSYVDLHPDLTAWLDENAPGWSFRSDWDYSNAGDDDEGCHLRVPTREAADAFIERATAMSSAWVEADRATMRHRIVIETPDGDHEIYRSHSPSYGTLGDRDLVRHFVLDRQPMRARVFRAVRQATMDMDAMPEDGSDARVEAAFEPEDLIRPGTRLAVIRLARPRSDGESTGDDA